VGNADRLRWLLFTIGLTLTFASTSAAQPSARRVLLLYSFDRGFAPDVVFANAVRTELSTRSPQPMTFFELWLQPTPSVEGFQEQAAFNYLKSSLASQHLDLVVTISGPAAVFAQKYGQMLFPETPILLAGVDRRYVRSATLTARETAVPIMVDPVRIVEDLLRVLPQTSHVFVVIGSSPFENLWREEFSHAVQPLADRVRFSWFNELSFDEMLNRSAALPVHSAILYVLLSVDAKGSVHADERALPALHAVANAPMFGSFGSHVGRGVVGGPVVSVADVAQNTAEVAVRLLRGEPATTIKIPAQAPGRPTYDWRELRRWGISETLLPPGSLVLFRPPTLWNQYKLYIVAVMTVVTLEGGLIAGLWLQRRRWRRAERALRSSETALRSSYREVQALVGRLIGAQETERARIARDLHDDFSQELALLSVEISQLMNATEGANGVARHGRAAKRRAADIATGIHNLSHELHPARLEMLGLGSALQGLCREMSAAHNLRIEFSSGDTPSSMPKDVALCLFRVAQEALRNVVKHSAARDAHVKLWHADGMLALRIADSGRGFSLRSGSEGLGLVSMRERVQFLGGQISVQSTAQKGTEINVSVPVSWIDSEAFQPRAANGPAVSLALSEVSRRE
jgi:signal transduction histidine kinase